MMERWGGFLIVQPDGDSSSLELSLILIGWTIGTIRTMFVLSLSLGGGLEEQTSSEPLP